MTLDEVIEANDPRNITLEKLQILQDPLKRKKKQEELRREHHQRQVLHEIKDVFVDAFDIHDVNEKNPIIDQLIHFIEKVNNDDIEANEKLLKWSEKKFEHKLLEKVSIEIAIKQDELSNIVNIVEGFLQIIFSLQRKLCDFEFFTLENQQSNDKLQAVLKSSGHSLSRDTSSSSMNFNRLSFTQGRLAKLQAKDYNMRDKFLPIQSMLLRHLEVIQKELSATKDLVRRDSQLSTIDNLVYLPAQLEIKIQV